MGQMRNNGGNWQLRLLRRANVVNRSSATRQAVVVNAALLNRTWFQLTSGQTWKQA